MPTTVTQPRLHHLALTVTDLDASVRWYEAVFDVHPVMDLPHPGGVGCVMRHARLPGVSHHRPRVAFAIPPLRWRFRERPEDRGVGRSVR